MLRGEAPAAARVVGCGQASPLNTRPAAAPRRRSALRAGPRPGWGAPLRAGRARLPSWEAGAGAHLAVAAHEARAVAPQQPWDVQAAAAPAAAAVGAAVAEQPGEVEGDGEVHRVGVQRLGAVVRCQEPGGGAVVVMACCVLPLPAVELRS